jgi:hypothetical protein
VRSLPTPFSFSAICFYVQVEGNLRGATIIETSEDLERLDRELQLSLGTSSRSVSFSAAAASYGAIKCFDPYSDCLYWGHMHVGTYTDANAEGNSEAFADSHIELCLYAFCKAYANAFAQACAFSKVDGDIKIDTTNTNGVKEVSLSVSLKTATKTLAIAESEARAKSYVDAGAVSFTSVEAYCTAVNNNSPYCGAAAGTGLFQVATADAKAYGSAGSLATSGSVTKQYVSVSAKGRTLDYINGLLAVYAKSWAFADAGAVASTYADALAAVANLSFAAVCVGEHARICGDSMNHGKPICGQTADEACAVAIAGGYGLIAACSHAVAESYVEAESKATAHVLVSANVDCRGSAASVTWKHASAGHDVSC